MHQFIIFNKVDVKLFKKEDVKMGILQLVQVDASVL